MKLHELDPVPVLAARQAVGPGVELMLDPNCGWSCEEALRMVDPLRTADLRWVEDAIWPPEDHQSMRRLRGAGLRVAAGENTGTLFDFARLLERTLVDVVQPDVTKVGGITEWRKLAALAEAHGVFLSPHSACYGPGFLATVHLLAAQPVPSVLECMYLSLQASSTRNSPRRSTGASRYPLSRAWVPSRTLRPSPAIASDEGAVLGRSCAEGSPSR